MVLTFIGIVISLIVQYIKKRFELSKSGTIAVVVLISFVGAVAFKLLTHYGLWQVFWATIVTSGAFYAFILKHIAKSLEDGIPNVDNHIE